MTTPTTTRLPTAYDMATPLAFPWSVDHTPVTARHGGDIPAYQIRGAGGETVCVLHFAAEESVQSAQAALIAAAPELFEALEYFFNIMHDYESSRQKGYVKAALDKAWIALGRVHVPRIVS